MKLTSYLLVVIGLCLYSSLFAQADIKSKLITAGYKDSKLSDVIADITQRYNIQFSFNSSVGDADTKISMTVKEMPFDKFMSELCTKAHLDYEIISGNVVLKKSAGKRSIPKQTIRGQILDSKTLQPVEAAAVRLVDSTLNLAALSDSLGFFRIDGVPVGRRTLKISILGYADAIYPDMLLEASKELVLNVQIKAEANQLGEVSVYAVNRGEAVNELATVSATSISVEETKRFVAAAFDPARVAQNLAGVACAGDLNNQLVIRGNSPQGVMYRMEGVEIINPNHFSALGSTGGAISMLSSSTLSTSDFYTGAFPSEYGDALSGVMDLKLRSGNNEEREHSFMIGLLGVEAATEGYFTHKSEASYLVNYRYSTLGLLGKFLPDLGSFAPDYQDLSFKINVPTKRFGTFSIWGIMGKSDAKNTASPDSSTWNTGSGGLSFKQYDLRGAYGITHKYILNEKSYLQSVVSFSGDGSKESDSQYLYDTALINRKTGDINLNSYFIRLSELYNFKLSAASNLRTGIVLTTTGFNYKFSQWDVYTDATTGRYNAKGWTEMMEAYAEWQQKFGPHWTLNGGVHFTYLFLNNTYAVDPRASVQFRINKNHSLAFSTGLYSKPYDISTLLYSSSDALNNASLPNKNLQIPQAYHAVLGYTYNFKNDFQLKTEVYFQYLFKVGISTDSSSAVSLINAQNSYDIWAVTSPFASKGTGMNYGVDITLQKFFTRGYYFLFTTSLFNSTYQTLTGKIYPSTYDRNYTVNVLGGKEFRVGKNKANVIGINTKFLVMGGNRYTPINFQQSSLQHTEVDDLSAVNSLHAPRYYRWDLGVSFRFNTKRITHTLMVDIQNVTSHLNIYSQVYDNKTNSIQYYYQQGLFPLFNYRIEFATK